MIALLGAIAEFERGLLLERQREGVGRQRQSREVAGCRDLPGTSRFGVASVYRVLADAKKKRASQKSA